METDDFQIVLISIFYYEEYPIKLEAKQVKVSFKKKKLLWLWWKDTFLH